jgi:hypothetical protein
MLLQSVIDKSGSGTCPNETAFIFILENKKRFQFPGLTLKFYTGNLKEIFW